MYKQKYITGIFGCDIIKLVFRNNTCNVCIICIWFNAEYSILNFYRTTIQCYCSNGPTLYYLKCPFIRGFVFEIIIIIEHDFISNFIVVVYSFTIFQILSLLICAWFRWCINYQSNVCLIKRIMSLQNNNLTRL